MDKENKKKLTLVVLAVVVPFGLTALGIWKAYELYKEQQRKKNDSN